MKLQPLGNNPVHLVGKKGVKDKDLTFVTIANKTTYEVLETKLALAEGQSINDIVEQRDYTAVIEYDGKWGSVTLAPVKA